MISPVGFLNWLYRLNVLGASKKSLFTVFELIYSVILKSSLLEIQIVTRRDSRQFISKLM